MIIGHGGNKQALASYLGCVPDEIIDMSSNLNPLGPPDFIEPLIRESLIKIRSLPEPDAKSMCRGFARFHSLNVEQVIAGNGTTWFIYTLPLALKSKKALIAGPTYSDYQDSCSMNRTGYVHVYSSPDTRFIPDLEKLANAAGKADIAFICNPNNPTGTIISKEKLIWLINKHPQTVFVVDESYLPFVNEAESISLVNETGLKNLVVLSSMSKIFRIPGLRTGFLSGSRPLLERVMNYYQPWSVNALAQEVVNYIFDHPDTIEPFYLATRKFISVEKEKFIGRLNGVTDLEIFESDVYFILARLSGNMRSDQFCRCIGEDKLLIRNCSNFEGLSDRYVRFSLKEREVNMRLADRIRETLLHD